ncbi:MAG: DUF502 domain-containing protein [Proteobacteria bacterium]|nr:DUF502 domain-containing protein [Pseudomonadota bacterium]
MSPFRAVRRFNLFTWLRNSFLAGVAVVLPFVVTIWVIWLVVSVIDHNVTPLIPARLKPFTPSFFGSGVIIAVIVLTLIGALAGNLVGRWVVNSTDDLIANLPLVRSIYSGAKQVFRQVAAPGRTSFKQAVLLEFPYPGIWTIGFITNEHASEVVTDIGDDDLVAVFVPHAPVPTSGYLLYMKRAALKPLSIGPDEAIKRVISLGIIRGEDPPTQS